MWLQAICRVSQVKGLRGASPSLAQLGEIFICPCRNVGPLLTKPSDPC